MIGKKINQLATELAPTTTDLTIIGDPVTGVSKKITLEQLGAIFGGAVSFYTTLGDFPATGVIDIIYCAKDTKKLYLWSGSAYVEVFPSQSLLDTYQLRSEKGVSNGYASLDVNGKVPIGQLPNSIMEYKGTWNAATNTPTLANGTGDTGDVYICNAAGTVNFGAGPITFAVGDYVVYSGSIWQRSSGAVGTVTSVGLSITGDSIGVTGSPITTSGTLALAFAGNSTQYINGAGNLVTFPGVINEAQNLITEVYNKTGATLTKGTIVYINGGQGNLPTVTKALATGDSTSAQTYGIVRNDITNNNNGYVVVAGRISDLDTQAYTEGTQLYLSPTTAGTFTSTKPYAPQHLVYVGIVVRAHPTQGVVEVKIQNGYEMDELHNVAAQSPDNNDILQYKTATSLWTKVAGTTTNIAEGTNLYYTDARSRAALSFTAGSGAYNSTTGVITIPTNTNQLTNGAAFITLASLSAGAGISYNNTTGVIASTITQYTDALARAAISLTTTGTSGAATYNNTTGVLNIPQYQTALTNPVTGTGTTNYLPKFTGTSTIGNSNIQDSGSLISVGVAATFSGVINANSSGQLKLESNNETTNIAYANFINTSGFLRWGVESSAGGGLFSGSSAYSSVIGTVTNTNFHIATNTSIKLTLNASGNLSIGNTNDTYKLDVSGTGRFLGTDGTRVLEISTGGATFTRINGSRGNANDLHVGNVEFYNTNSSRIIGEIRAITGNSGTQSNSGQLAFYTNDNGTYAERFKIASTGAATFSSSVTANSTINGYYGSISTGQSPATSGTTPNNPMLNLTNNRGVGLYVGGQHASPFGIWLQVSDTSNLGTNYPLLLQPNGGNVGIGTTSPAALFHIEKSSNSGSGSAFPRINVVNSLGTQGDGSSTFNFADIRISAGNGAVDMFLATTFASGTWAPAGIINVATNHDLQIKTNNTERMRITSGGAVEMTGTIKTASPSSGSAHAWKLGSYAAGGTGTATGVIYIEVNGQIYSIPALLGTP